MTTNCSEIERIYNLINLFRMSKMDVGEYIKVTPKFIEDFGDAIKAVTQISKEITDPHLHCFISNVNMQYTILDNTEDSYSFMYSGLGASIGGLLGVLYSKIFIPNKGVVMHKSSIFGLSILGAAIIENSLFEKSMDQKKLDILSDTMISCYGSMEKIGAFGILPDECEIIG